MVDGPAPMARDQGWMAPQVSVALRSPTVHHIQKPRFQTRLLYRTHETESQDTGGNYNEQSLATIWIASPYPWVEGFPLNTSLDCNMMCRSTGR